MSQSDCWVMCGGASAINKLDVSDPIIAVNKDVWRYTDADYFITMDNRFALWEVTNKRDLPSKPVKVFVANMASENLKCEKSFMDKRWGMSYDLSYYDWIVKSFTCDGFGFRWNDFRNGGNSGYCGIQLAILLGFKNIHIVGMDMCKHQGATHHHGGYHRCTDDYDRVFEEQFGKIRRAIVNELSYHPDIKLINHSPISRLREVIGYTPL